MNDQPDISVVIPVFNKAGSLARCLESVARQAMGPHRMQVVVVDDGSTDNSLDIAQGFAGRIPSIRLFHQENGGVSSARNRGVELSGGRYVLFLDADDQLGPGSIQHIVETFDAHSAEVDLLAYPIVYINPLKGTRRRHRRERWLDHTGIFRLDEYPYICQNTMNICVKRDAALAHPFDETLRMGEDQLFSTRIMAATGAIAHCAQAEYRYYKDGTGASAFLNKPLYAFEDMIRLFHAILDIARTRPAMSAYCHELVLHNVNWRLRADELFPDFGNSATRALNNGELARVMQSIPAEHVLGSRSLNNSVKLYLLDRFNMLAHGLRIEYGRKHARLYHGDDLLWKAQKPTIRIMRCVQHRTHLELMGFVECPVFYAEERTPKLSVRIDTEKRTVPLAESSYCMKGANVRTTRAWRFDLSIPLSREVQTATFSLAFGSDRVPSLRVSLQMARANARAEREENLFAFSKCVLVAKDKGFMVYPRKRLSLADRAASGHEDDPAAVQMRRAVRKQRMKLRGHSVWLYADDPIEGTTGNALAQILHDLPKRDGVRRFYVAKHREELEHAHPELAGHVAEHGSEEHAALYLLAAAVLAAHPNPATFMPCDSTTFEKFGDQSCAKTLLYLQQGVLHAHAPWNFAYDRMLFDYTVVSSQAEYDNLVRNNYYPAERLVCSGAPRFDSIRTSSPRSRRAIYAPSWRSYLVTASATGYVPAQEMFAKSAFYRNTRAFLKAVSESGVLEQHGFTLDVKLHPHFCAYAPLLETADPRITAMSDVPNPGDYAIMVTDFSSYLYDFVYAGCRIQHFLPDEEEFYGGVNFFRELDPPFVGDFGPYSTDPHEAALQFEKLVEQAVQMAADGTPRTPSSGLFLHADGQNAERLYRALCELC